MGKRRLTKKLSLQWETGAIGRIDQLAATGRTVESMTADAFLANSESFDRIDRMIAKAEARRNAALRELERRRSSMAQALRRVSDDVVDAEFVDVAHDPITNTASFDSSVISAGSRCRRSGISGLPSRLQLLLYHREHDPPSVGCCNVQYEQVLGP